MPTTHTEFFITVSANDIGGTTTQDETKILEHYKSWMCLLLVREKHKSGNYHLHLYIRGFANRTDNLKRKLYNLLYGQIDKDTNEWKRRIVIKPVNDRMNTYNYLKKGLDDESGELVHTYGISWSEIAKNLERADVEWKEKKSLRGQKAVSYTSVPALMNVFYRQTMLKIDKDAFEDPRAIFINLMKSGTYLIFQHIPKLKGIIAQYRLVYMDDQEHMEDYIKNCIDWNC